jgi:cytochrome c-type biogenesis protein CcmH/NrfG
MAMAAQRGGENQSLFPFSELLKKSEKEEGEARISELQEILAVCPSDLATRGRLAMLLERLGRQADALVNWTAIVDHSPNDLQAREGVARCRRKMSSAVKSSEGI